MISLKLKKKKDNVYIPKEKWWRSYFLSMVMDRMLQNQSYSNHDKIVSFSDLLYSVLYSLSVFSLFFLVQVFSLFSINFKHSSFIVLCMCVCMLNDADADISIYIKLSMCACLSVYVHHKNFRPTQPNSLKFHACLT